MLIAFPLGGSYLVRFRISQASVFLILECIKQKKKDVFSSQLLDTLAYVYHDRDVHFPFLYRVSVHQVLEFAVADGRAPSKLEHRYNLNEKIFCRD